MNYPGGDTMEGSVYAHGNGTSLMNQLQHTVTRSEHE